MLEKRSSQQWFDPKLSRFLPDRYVKGRCPNPQCDNESAYSDECDRCGMQYEPGKLIHPKSAISDAVPVMKETVHWWLDMWKVSDILAGWLKGKTEWRKIGVESGWGVQPCNDIKDAGKLPVDFDYYVREVEKLCLGLA